MSLFLCQNFKITFSILLENLNVLFLNFLHYVLIRHYFIFILQHIKKYTLNLWLKTQLLNSFIKFNNIKVLIIFYLSRKHLHLDFSSHILLLHLWNFCFILYNLLFPIHYQINHCQLFFIFSLIYSFFWHNFKPLVNWVHLQLISNRLFFFHLLVKV